LIHDAPADMIAAASRPAFSRARACVLAGAMLLWAGPALADLRICNNTTSRVGVALGYRDAQGWITEGWWNLSPRGCETILRGTLAARFYYIHAVDYDKGGEWDRKVGDVRAQSRVHHSWHRGLPAARL
jgi:uncharacterized membrane protein